MSEPPQHSNWQAYKVIDGNTNQTANGSSCAIIEFYKGYTSVWLSINLQRLFNVAYTEIYFRDEGSKFRKKKQTYFYRTNSLSMRIGIPFMLGLMKYINKIILGFFYFNTSYCIITQEE